MFSIGYAFHLGNGDNSTVWGITNYKDQSRNQAFTYDALNRLTSAQNAGTDCSQMTVNNKPRYWGNGYTYDAWGNLTEKGNLPGAPGPKCGSESLDVTADALNRLHVKAGADYQYDAAGNMTYHAKDGLYYTYDQENRITGAGGYTYTYDADGSRVKKTNGSTGTLYWYMAPGIVAESDLNGNLQSEYVFFDGERVARKDFPGLAVSYYFSDHLNTASVITDAAGNIKAESDYYPWGGELQFLANDSNHYKFTGKERDSETGLDYFGARYYGSGLGRFTSPDSIANDWQLRNPQTWNRYAYAWNSPLVYRDPEGRAVELLGDENQRKAELAELQKNVGNKDAASRLYINDVKDGDKTRYFVGIKGDVGDFMKLSATSHDPANLVANKNVVEFGLTDKDLSKWGGAATYAKGEVGNENVRVLVNPKQMIYADEHTNPNTILGASKWKGQKIVPPWQVRPFTPGIAEWHELGHAWGYIHGRANEAASAGESVAWENRMREQVYGPLGPDNAPRANH